MLQAGQLRHRVTIQAPAPSTNPFQVADGWTDVLTTWAKVSPATSKEIFQASQQSMQLTHTVTMHYPGKQFKVSAGYRLLFNGRVFELQKGIVNTDERNIELVLSVWEIDTVEGGTG
jgi:SPP1 family predicted phage head-tail adaptor